MLNLSRSRIKFNSLLYRRFFSTEGTTDYSDISSLRNVDRGIQVKGAMTEYLKKTSVTSKDSIWLKLGTNNDPTKNKTIIDKNTINLSNDDNDNNNKSFRKQNKIMNNRIKNPRTNQNVANTTNKKVKGDHQEDDFEKGFHTKNKSFFDDEDSMERHMSKMKDFSSDGDNKNEDIPLSIASVLFDHEHLKVLAAEGFEIDDEEMDPIDKAMSDIFMECIKTESGVFNEVYKTQAYHKTILPKPRSMADLNLFMQPDIQSVPKNTPGYELAEQAWGVIQKNIYYEDKDKYRFVECIAKLQNKIHKVNDNLLKSDLKDELVLQPGFRKGREFYEEEYKLKLLAGNKLTERNEFQQDDTDWDVEAVVDEDQL